jgi:hypothetical protein
VYRDDGGEWMARDRDPDPCHEVIIVHPEDLAEHAGTDYLRVAGRG